MADISRIILVNFNDMAASDSRILVTVERAGKVAQFEHYLRTNYPRYSQGQLGFFLLFGYKNEALSLEMF